MTKDKTKIERIAGKLANQFETRKRDNGENFICQKRNKGLVHDWIQDKIQEIHDDYFPNDAMYQLIYDCLRHIGEGNEDYLEADIYTKDLIAWTQNNFADEFLDGALREYQPESFCILLGLAQDEWKRQGLDKVKSVFFGI